MNIKLTYLYRDGANYKQFNEVVFCNPEKILLEEVEETIIASLIDGTWFVADNWSLPNMFFKEYMWNNEVDHNWHEFECVKETEMLPTEEMAINKFLVKIRIAQ